MAFSCIPSFAQLFAFTTAPSNTPQQQPACDLNDIPYPSWRPPTCPQKCSAQCPHLPVSNETRVNGQLLNKPPADSTPSDDTPADKPDPAAHTRTQVVEGPANMTSMADESRRDQRAKSRLVQTYSDQQTAGHTGPRQVGKAVKTRDDSGKGACTRTWSMPLSPTEEVDGEHTPDLSSLFDQGGTDADAESVVVTDTKLIFDANPGAGTDAKDTPPEQDDGSCPVKVVAHGQIITCAQPEHDFNTEHEAYVEVGASPRVRKDAATCLLIGEIPDPVAEENKSKDNEHKKVECAKADGADGATRRDSIVTVDGVTVHLNEPMAPTRV